MALAEYQAVNALAALAQETRLAMVRLLVDASPEGVASGTVAQAVGTSPSNVTFHLKELERAGLARSRRVGRSIVYGAELGVLSDLIRFLAQDCGRGRPEVCAPLIQALSHASSRAASDGSAET